MIFYVKYPNFPGGRSPSQPRGGRGRPPPALTPSTQAWQAAPGQITDRPQCYRWTQIDAHGYGRPKPIKNRFTLYKRDVIHVT